MTSRHNGKNTSSSKPGNITKASDNWPYQPRIDWQIWFAQWTAEQNPAMHMIWKLGIMIKIPHLLPNNLPIIHPMYIRWNLPLRIAEPGQSG